MSSFVTQNGLATPNMILIDSSKRDKTQYPNSNSFVVKLDRTFYNVKTARMTTAMIPSTDYVINDHNNKFIIEANNTQYICTIPKGYFTSITLATHLQTAFNDPTNWDSDPSIEFTVAYQSASDNYKISGDSAFIIKFSYTQLLAKMLGFDPSDTTSATDHVGIYAPQINNTPIYYISIPELESSIASIPVRAFGFVFNRQNFGSINYYQETDYGNIVHLLNKDIATSLTVRLLDQHGNLCDIRNSDWYIQVAFS